MTRTGSDATLRRRPLQYHALLVCGLMVAGTTEASAHERGVSVLHLRVAREHIEGDWELTTSDARQLVGAPRERVPDRLSPREEAALAESFLGRVRVASPDGNCPIRITSGPGLQQGEPPTEALSLVAACSGPMEQVRIVYSVLFEEDPDHRGYFSLRDADHTQAGVFHAAQQEIQLRVRHPNPWRTLLAYAREGAWHVWDGADHILFLVVLLLPAVLGDVRGRDATHAPRWRAVAWEIAGIVTAFTLAHSATLALAVLGYVTVPARPVEILIALSIFAAAWNNVRPWLPVGVSWMALVFGLVHGLGFASGLLALGLPSDSRGLALAGFNLGVEGGQLAVVAVWLPVAFAVRRTAAYARWVVPGASLAIAWIAALWTLERMLDLELLPRQ